MVNEMNREIELIKIQVLSEYYHSRFTFVSSIVVGGFIGIIVASMTLYYEGVINTLTFTVGSSVALIVFGYFGLNMIFKHYQADLVFVDKLLDCVQRGEPLPPIEQLMERKRLEKRNVQK